MSGCLSPIVLNSRLCMCALSLSLSLSLSLTHSLTHSRSLSHSLSLLLCTGCHSHKWDVSVGDVSSFPVKHPHHIFFVRSTTPATLQTSSTHIFILITQAGRVIHSTPHTHTHIHVQKTPTKKTSVTQCIRWVVMLILDWPLSNIVMYGLLIANVQKYTPYILIIA